MILKNFFFIIQLAFDDIRTILYSLWPWKDEKTFLSSEKSTQKCFLVSKQIYDFYSRLLRHIFFLFFDQTTSLHLLPIYIPRKHRKKSSTLMYIFIESRQNSIFLLFLLWSRESGLVFIKQNKTKKGSKNIREKAMFSSWKEGKTDKKSKGLRESCFEFWHSDRC